MNHIYILYLANNKVNLVAQLLPLKLKVIGSIPKNNPSQNPKLVKSVVDSQQPSQYPN